MGRWRVIVAVQLFCANQCKYPANKSPLKTTDASVHQCLPRQFAIRVRTENEETFSKLTVSPTCYCFLHFVCLCVVILFVVVFASLSAYVLFLLSLFVLSPCPYFAASCSLSLSFILFSLVLCFLCIVVCVLYLVIVACVFNHSVYFHVSLCCCFFRVLISPTIRCFSSFPI